MKNNFFILLLFIFCCTSVKSIDNEIMSQVSLNEISLKDKISQMIMIRVDGKYYTENHWKETKIKDLIQEYKIGGVITYGGSVHGTFYRLKDFQEISKIPLFVAADYERGLGTFMNGTLFPPNMALAATEDTNLAYLQGKYIASEAKSIGVNMIFAPVLDINNNLNNPIINIRSYGDNPQNVIKYGVPFIKGIQENGILACAKHFPGHGNTSTDSHSSLPIINISRDELDKNELLPFYEAVKNDVGSIMTAHIMIPSIDKSPATFSQKITEGILRNEWNYDGLVVTDALEMGALTSISWHGESAIRAVEGGADIILLPLDAIEAINSIYNAVKTGRISEDRINESYRRIIDSKINLNLFKNSFKTTWSTAKHNIGTSKHVNTASQIAQKSITLVKNEADIIPFVPKKYNNVTHIMLSTDDDLRTRLKSIAYDIRYTHGNVNEIYINDPLTDLMQEDIINKVKSSDIIVVSMLIRISMNKGISTIHKTHSKLLKEIKKLNIPIIGMSFGSPYLPDYEVFNSYICAYGYGKVSLDAAINSFFGRNDIVGKLPVSLNKLYPSGYGIQVKKKSNFFSKLNNFINFNDTYDIVYEAISDSIFPGAQIFVSKGEEILINKGFGNLTYEKTSVAIDTKTIYDIASLTKVISATPVVMKLIQKKRISLDYNIYQFYPEFKIGDKKQITIRHLLTHTSGLPAYVEYYKDKKFKNRESILNDIVNMNLIYKPDEKVIYSDLGMILLLDIIEKITGEKFDRLASRYFYSPLNMKNTFFNPDSVYMDNIAPSEIDNYFRNRVVKGEVHDENAYILGGVSTHAGLFSTANDLGLFSKMLIDDGIHLGKRYLSKSLIKKFTKRYGIPKTSERTIGWDTPSRNGTSSAGDYFSYSSFGHLGFTGTSLWIDPEKDIIVIVLTNRTYPSRNNSKKMYKFRREFHNSLMKKIGS